MTPEKQQIAIAEACGTNDPHWFCPSCNREVSPQMVRFNETHDGCGATCTFNESPNYLNDLNAIDDAVRSLSQIQQFRYMVLLEEITEQVGCVGFKDWNPIRISHATAAQRCEAFLKALNLWEAAQ